ncbi:MAG: DUF4105 domain-containing protein [Halobacteriovoraceae bacterium]|nr:DUF4105 domain-containing protein [Halobacteriovoraceae bacterium]MCB9093560.1 DUF4105 domain-containing protein [Halobacteriovoraceae bacterium]
MLTFLILIFFSLPVLGYQSDWQELAHSKTWLRLYQYQKTWSGNYESSSINSEFFFTQNVEASPMQEFQAAIKLFKDRYAKIGALKVHPQCAFPARFSFIKKHLDISFPNIHCPQLDNWLKHLSMKEVRVVYAGRYPKNPASIFGHTFLRFPKNENENYLLGDDLLSYSVAFLAAVDPRDDKLSYTLKGMTGQYPGYFNIKPLYENVSMYANAESRDLWEYRLNLTEEEVEFFSLILWEFSQNTGFRYYFFDENCSYYLVKILEILREDIELSIHDLFFLPSESLKLLEENFGATLVHTRASIEKKTRYLVDQMNSSQTKNFLEARKNKEFLNTLNDRLVLDALLEYWKKENYLSNTKLSEKRKPLYETTLAKRASLKKTSPHYPYQGLVKTDPLNGHGPRKLKLQFRDDDNWFFSAGLGFHNREDDFEGFSEASYIDYLNFKLRYDKDKEKTVFETLDIVEIYSYDDFTQAFPFYSWNLKISYQKYCEKCLYRDKNFLHLKAGGGFASLGEENNWLISLMGNIQNFYHVDRGFLYPSLEIFVKKILKSARISFLASTELYHHSGFDHWASEVSLIKHNLKNIDLGLHYGHDSYKKDESISLFLKTYF